MSKISPLTKIQRKQLLQLGMPQEVNEQKTTEPTKKRIELYAFVLNDEDLLPLFLEYYTPFVDKMTFFDSGSTDGTLELLKNYKVIQTGFTTQDVPRYMEFANNVWKKSEYDLVFFPHIDEILYKEDLKEFLDTHNYDIYQAKGYNMVSDEFPKKLSDVTKGVADYWFDKCIIFNPKIQIYFDAGFHTMITNSKNINRFDIKLLHYRFLGVNDVLKRRQLAVDRNGKEIRSIDKTMAIYFQTLNDATEVL